jgi:hypothetical protein
MDDGLVGPDDGGVPEIAVQPEQKIVARGQGWEKGVEKEVGEQEPEGDPGRRVPAQRFGWLTDIVIHR